MIPSRREVLCTAIAVGLLACAAFAKPKKTPVDLYVYELLSNEYRRSFVETHNKVCEFFDTQGKFTKYYIEHIPQSYKLCPFPKGVYHFVNMSFPDVPLLSTFPFTQGRLYVNASLWQTGERVMEVYVDVAINQRWR